MSAKLKNKSVSSNSQFCEALVNQVKAKGDFLEKVFGALIAAKHEHISMTDPLMVALQNPEIYHALNYLFESPLHTYHCFNNAFQFLPFDEMAWHKVTPLVDVVRAFSEVKEATLSAHLNTVNSIS